MPRSVYNIKGVIPEIEPAFAFEPEMDIKRKFICVAGFVERHISVVHRDFCSGKAVRRDYRVLLKIPVGSDVVKVFMRVYYNINIPYF